MTRFGYKNLIFLLFLISTFSFSSFGQNVTGIWKGYFISEDGQHYRLEFQVKQNESGTLSTTGVSYSWQDDIRFYGKATMTGNFIQSSKNFRIREIKTVELNNPMGGTCIMNYNLVYSKSGKEEFLEGTYLGKPEVKTGTNPYEWGECGSGKVQLRKVTQSDFYLEPFLRTPKVTTAAPKKTTNPPVVTKPPVTAPPATKKPVTTVPKTNTGTVKATPTKPVAEKSKVITTPPKTTTDSTNRKIAETIKPTPEKVVIPTPAVLKNRQNELVKALVINSRDVTVKLYDNGEIDDDSISVFLNKKLVLSNKRLTASPLTIKLKMDEENDDQELVMVAENLGRIPPNTSLMVVEAGDQRFDVRITSTEQKNAVVRFKYQKP